MHKQAHDYVKGVVVQRSAQPIRPRDLVVEIGARHINGSVKGLFDGHPYIGTDIAPGPGVDVVVDGALYQPKSTPTVVVCCEVLEHAAQADAIIANAHKMLAPGGVFIATMAGVERAPHSGVDGGHLREGEFYRNVAGWQLHEWLTLAGFERIEIACDEVAGDVYCTAYKGE